MLAFARCMREHGIDMPDPQFETGGMVMIGGQDEGGAGPKFDPRSEEFQAAEDGALAVGVASTGMLGAMPPSSGQASDDPGANAADRATVAVERRTLTIE